MSIWTHVNASFRLDAIRAIGEYDLEKELGKPSLFDDWNDDCKLPCGSEGSIEYSIYTNPDESTMAAYVINFWGDLRDYENQSELEEFFKSFLKDKIIRQGFLEIDIEFQKKLYYYVNSKNELIKILELFE